MAMFACFAPSFVVKNNEIKGYSKASDGIKKRSNKRDRRVKPIDIVSPAVSDDIKKRSKLGHRVKPIDIVRPSTVDGSKKRSKWSLWDKATDIASPSAKDSSRKKWGLRVKPIDVTSPSADGSKKRRNKWGLRVKHIDIVSLSTKKGDKMLVPVSKSLPLVANTSSMSPKMVSDDSLARVEPTGEAEHDDLGLMNRDHSDLDLQPKGELAFHGLNMDLNNYALEEKIKTDDVVTLQAMIACGNASDPWMERTSFIDSSVLQRSCSNIESKQAKGFVKSPKLSSSCNNLENLSGSGEVGIAHGTHSSPLSVWTSHSADCVMLKRVSLRQVFPSKGRKIMWMPVLQSHSDLHRPRALERLFSVLIDTNEKCVYSSDMHEPDQRLDHKNNKAVELESQWVAYSSGSSHMDRVSAWVNSLEHCSFLPVDVEEHCDEIEHERTTALHHLKIGESSVKKCSDTYHRETEELAQPNNIIQSLNSFSSVAHISSIGLKVVPSISAFIYLRSANLSGNCIVHITPGSLPKSLHTLDLSRNKILTIEGLRNLERLRVLNLSYNRISRIGHGLSSCTLIKELYLAGNRVSIVEGLHRVLKLAVLDLSFNKIASTKALGQLAANYNCLLALNLTGNPVQANIGDDQLKKEVLNILPHVTYLNKHSIKSHKVHDVPTNSVAKAALADAPRRKITRRLSQGSDIQSKRTSEGSFRAIKHRSKSMQSSPGRR